MLGSFLATLRASKGLTMAQVIDALQVPRSTAYVWESESGRPEPEQLQRLLDLYEASDADRLRAWELRAAPITTSNATEPVALG